MVVDAANSARVFDDVALVTRGDVALALWKGAATARVSKWLFDRLDELVATQPGGVMVFQMILPSSTPPDGGARAENHRRLQALGPSLRRLVSVPLGDALWTNVVRTVMRGMAMVSGQGKTQLVANDERSGLDLVVAGAGPSTPPRRELEAAVEELYRSLSVPRPSPAGPFRRT